MKKNCMSFSTGRSSGGFCRFRSSINFYCFRRLCSERRSGIANKTNGFNLKYRYEQDNNPLGVIGSFTYTEKDRTTGEAFITKLSTTASLLVRLSASMTGRASTV